MSTPSTPSLDELEVALNAVVVRMKLLADENERLRAELAETGERMRSAGHQLRVVAQRLPQAASADVPQEKAA